MNDFLNSIAEGVLKPRDPQQYKHSIVTCNLNRFDTLIEKFNIYQVSNIFLGKKKRLAVFFTENLIWDEETDFIQETISSRAKANLRLKKLIKASPTRLLPSIFLHTNRTVHANPSGGLITSQFL